ncbi:restriction endonuclease subunit R [Thermococcus sp. P6]|uniref:type I restriction endonuclease subunit R n=1 Tax=Thermococcus sp. P6 TaxID=122420 RepID=UPI000B59E3FB|nr:HsdR family type I site-specific deoxyribonuclease [Thermococcus sp. P6]ASJ10036.1 restriction endonuclease subunit R [Thermococcus sp. P6]
MGEGARLNEGYMVEDTAINVLKGLGYAYVHGSELTPEEGERESYRDVILRDRFLRAVKRLNPWLTDELALKVYEMVRNPDHPDFVVRGMLFYDMLSKGVKLTFKTGGEEKTRFVRLVDFQNPDNNEFLVSNQFTVEYYYENDRFRRPDMVVFINGLPIAIFEFKGYNSNQTAKDAFNDHDVKKKDIPQLYQYAQILVASDGVETRYGSPTSGWDRFFVWEGVMSDDDVRPIEVEGHGALAYEYNGKQYTSLDILLMGLFRREHLLEYLEDFIVYDRRGKSYSKIIATYYQFYTVKKAVERTMRAVLHGEKPEDRRIGIVWHAQGTGKSITMLLYAKKVLKVRELNNPLLIFLTDRRELDEQLYEVFANVFTEAEHVESITELQEAIKKTPGGIIFATIQKFGRKSKDEEYPFLTDRRNVIVIADEAHRSQYGQLAQNLRRAIPNASFLAFTATPIDYDDRSTFLVFGDYVSAYPMDKARRHNVVVPIYYEARLTELHLTKEFIDLEFENLSEKVAADPETKEGLKRAFAKLERIMLTEEYLSRISKDIVEHFNRRVQDFDGKAMVVTISRRVAVELYGWIVKQPKAPKVAVVISGDKSRDPEEFHPHIRTRKQLEDLAKEFKDPESDLKMVIVVDMWLTGFDVPPLHTMYFWKPMKNHSLVQAIARVNRVYKDKPGGLIVDYIGIADDLSKSLSKYSSEARRDIMTDIRLILDTLKKKHEDVKAQLKGIDYRNWKDLSPEELSRLTVKAYGLIARSDEAKKKFVRDVVALKKLYLLASPHPEATAIKEELQFFEMIKRMIVKYSTRLSREISKELEREVQEIISRGITAREPVDIFEMLRKKKPEISILSDEFLNEFTKIENKNYVRDVLMKILSDELRFRTRINPPRFKKFSEMLETIIEKHNQKLITTAEMIEELVELARNMRKAIEEGKELSLSDDELAFYDMLLTYPDLPIRERERVERIAREIARMMSGYVKVADWKRKKNLRAKIRAGLKMILVKEGINDYSLISNLSDSLLEYAEGVYGIREGA